MPRPADLHTMYREFCSRTPGYVQRKDACCSVNMNSEDNPFFESTGDNHAGLLNKLVSLIFWTDFCFNRFFLFRTRKTRL